uniref:rhomboid protease n=1 Tax=Globodera rostochiensis TaxID=31243 RepID=A0A914H8B5_GLORO
MEVNDSSKLLTPLAVLIRGGFFYLLTNGLLFTAAAFYDYKNGPPKLQSTPKLIWTLIGANVAVFLLWRVPALAPTMLHYFTSGVASENLCLSMFLSMFSHYEFLHLLGNMLTLENFAVGAIGLLGPAQFMAMYLSGGLFSALFSLCYNALMASTSRGLGASGAIYAVVGYVCAKLPDQLVHFSFLFLPMFQSLFYRFRTNGLFFTAAAVYDYKNVQPKLQSTHNWIWTLIGAVAVFLLWHVLPLVLAMCSYFTISVACGMFFGISLMLKALTAAANPPLSARGAIFVVVDYVCANLLDVLVQYIFVPMFPIFANSFLYGRLALETVNLLCSLPLGHAAHIGGLLFGMYYAHYGETCYRHLVNWLRGNERSRFADDDFKLFDDDRQQQKQKCEEGTNNGGWTTAKQQQQNNIFSIGRPQQGRLLTEDEYREEGRTFTNEQLGELKQFLQSLSPDVAWRLISRLNTRNNFLQFITGAEHISSQEQSVHSELYGVEEQNTRRG